MGSWLDEAIDAITSLGGAASLEDIYAQVRRARKEPLIYAYRAATRGAIYQHSSDSKLFRGGPDLFFTVEGLGTGVWGLRSASAATPRAVDLSDDLGYVSPVRVSLTTYRILRDTELARQVKLLHGGRCQMCGETIRLPDGRAYAEAHHVRPLGRPHDGPDVAGNIIVVCPNHHAMLDYGVIPIERAQMRGESGHVLAAQYVDYHNTAIYQRPS